MNACKLIGNKIILSIFLLSCFSFPAKAQASFRKESTSNAAPTSIRDVYLEPVLSYIPSPGAINRRSNAFAGTLRAIILF